MSDSNGSIKSINITKIAVDNEQKIENFHLNVSCSIDININKALSTNKVNFKNNVTSYTDNIHNSMDNGQRNIDKTERLQTKMSLQINNNKGQVRKVNNQNKDRKELLLELQTRFENLKEEYIQLQLNNKTNIEESKELDVVIKQLEEEILSQTYKKRILIKELSRLKKKVDAHCNDHQPRIRIIESTKNAHQVIKAADRENENLMKLSMIIRQDIKENKQLLKSFSEPDLINSKSSLLHSLNNKKRELEVSLIELNKIKDTHSKCDAIMHKLKMELLVIQEERNSIVFAQNKPVSKCKMKIINDIQQYKPNSPLSYCDQNKHSPSFMAKNISMPLIYIYNQSLKNQTSEKEIRISPASYKDDPISKVSLFKPEEKSLLQQVIPEEHLDAFEERFKAIKSSKIQMNKYRQQEMKYLKHSNEIVEADNTNTIERIALIKNEKVKLEIEFRTNKQNIINIRQRIKDILGCIEKKNNVEIMLDQKALKLKKHIDLITTKPSNNND